MVLNKLMMMIVDWTPVDITITVAVAIITLLLGIIIGGVKYFAKKQDSADSELTSLFRQQHTEISDVKLAVSSEVKKINETLSEGLANVHRDIGDLRGDMKAFKAISEEREKAENQRERRLQSVERSQSDIVKKLLDYLDKKEV